MNSLSLSLSLYYYYLQLLQLLQLLATTTDLGGGDELCDLGELARLVGVADLVVGVGVGVR